MLQNVVEEVVPGEVIIRGCYKMLWKRLLREVVHGEVIIRGCYKM